MRRRCTPAATQAGSGRLGGDGVEVILDFLLVGVDRDVLAGEVLQAAGMVQVKVAGDDCVDVVDAVADGG